PCVLTIGKFDGVHLGHQSIVKQLLQEARQRQLPAIVMIFEPQPLEYFIPESAPTRLMPFRQKYHYLSQLGVDYVLCVKFDQHFAQLSAQDFVTNILLAKLAVQYLLVGEDFVFGCQRQGNIDYLQQAAQQANFTLAIAPNYYLDQQKVSSTTIRQTLRAGHFAHA